MNFVEFKLYLTDFSKYVRIHTRLLTWIGRDVIGKRRKPGKKVKNKTKHCLYNPIYALMKKLYA